MQAPDKIKIPSLLSLQLVLTTDYIDTVLHLFQCQKNLARQRCKTVEEKAERKEKQKAVLRMLRRLECEHAAQLRERTRAMATFCILKAILQEKDNFEDCNREQLAGQCEGINVKTFNARLETLQALKLCEYREGKIYLCAWDKVCEVFKIPIKKRQPFYYIKAENKSISYVIKQKRRYEKELQCKRVAQLKLNKCTELRNELNSFSGKGNITLSALAEIQWRLFLHPELIDAFDLDAYLIFNVVRGDTSISYRFWSVMLGYRSKGGLAYENRLLIKAGLIVVTKRKTVIEVSKLPTVKSRSNCLGTGIYNPLSKTIDFYRPDMVEYLSTNSPKEKI